MDCELVSKNKMRIALNDKEASLYELGRNFDLKRNYFFNRNIGNLIENAVLAVNGFKNYGDVCVQCIDSLSNYEVYVCFSSKKKKSRAVFITYKRAFYEFGTYEFETTNDIISACQALFIRGYDKESSAYISHDGKLYLRLEKSTTQFFSDGCGKTVKRILDVVSEFGKRCDDLFQGDPTNLKCVCNKRAVERLALI